MGIKGLTKLIAAKSSASILERPISHYHGRIIGIDSYMLMYQFLVAMRGHSGAAFTDQSGDDSMHLYGIFHRTIKFMESGIFPLYVFDGEAPNMKSETLEKRGQSRKDAEEGYERAKEEGNEEDMKKFSKRNIKVSTKHVEEVKTLLTHMGIPYFE
ncbi:MAG: Elongation of fatty acids protein 2, partial [Marteilia pararefringens]